MNQILYNTSKTSDKSKLIIIILIVLIALLVCLSTVFALTNKNNDKILKNVFISGIEVSEKTSGEAEILLLEEVNGYANNTVTLVVNEKKYTYTPSDFGFRIGNISEVVDEAYGYGRDAGFFENNFTILLSKFKNKELSLEYILDEKKFNNIVNKISEESESLVKDDFYKVEGNQVIIVKGQDGLKIDSSTLSDYIVTSILNGVESVEVPIVESESKKLDIDKVYSEVYVAPQDATYTLGENFEVIVDKVGYDFDKEAAKTEYANLAPSGEMVIELKTIEPAVKVADLDSVLFKDTLSTFSSNYNVNEPSRITNLKTAAERINSKIIYPGEEFSFSKTIGTRTVANGYALGNSFAGGKVVKTVGGGICQISSGLYNVVLHADLEVVERKNHGMYVVYAEPSLDATIAEGSIDFRFKNSRKTPIKIFAEVKDGIATVSILGLKEANEPIIEIESVILETIDYTTIRQNDSSMKKGTTKVLQTPLEGYKSEAYRIEKDAAGNVISRILISSDRYAPTNEIISVGTKVDTPPPVVVEPTPEPVPEPTPEPVPEPEPERDLPPGWDSPESPYGR